MLFYSYAQDKLNKKNSAVLDFKAESGISKETASLLTNKFISSLQSTKSYKIMTRTEIKNILNEQQLQQSDKCSDSECAIQFGQILGVKNIIVGQIGMIGKVYVVILHMVNVETSEEIKTINKSYSGEIDILIPAMTEIAYEMAGLSSPQKIQSQSSNPQIIIPSETPFNTPIQRKVNITATPSNSPTPEIIVTSFPKVPAEGNYTEYYADLKIEMIEIKGDSFKMGSSGNDPYTNEDETPQHPVTLNNFWISKYEITVEQFEKFVQMSKYNLEADPNSSLPGRRPVIFSSGDSFINKEQYNWKNPGFKQMAKNPVVCISWNDAAAFCNWLSKSTYTQYSLPTEAQWEYVCSAKTETKYFWGDDEKNLTDYALTKQNSEGKTSSVGLKKGNNFGIYDICGNASEWCLDLYFDKFYKSSLALEKNPINENIGNEAIVRGGSWHNENTDCRTTARFHHPTYYSDNTIGFRIVRNISNLN